VADNTDAEEFAALATSLRSHLNRRHRAGILMLPKSAALDVRPYAGNEENRLGGTAGDLFVDNAAAFQASSLEELRAEIGDCQRCKLAPTRKNIVFGQGNPNARLMFVGEAPGADEDVQGEPFVVRAGQLLTKIIEAIGMKREEVYIANVIKCRPPGNRNPEPDEVEQCEPFLFRQIDTIKPKVIVALGKFAAQSLLRTSDPITRIRGREYKYRDAILMPTYHPAYLLRTPSAKREVWEDMKRVRAILSGD
jgi:uracil-DNA glycosylase family 4